MPTTACVLLNKLNPPKEPQNDYDFKSGFGTRDC